MTSKKGEEGVAKPDAAPISDASLKSNRGRLQELCDALGVPYAGTDEDAWRRLVNTAKKMRKVFDASTREVA